MAELAHWAATAPDRVALVTDTETLTFAQLDARASQVARALRRRGLKAGDAIAVIGSNQAAFVETVYAADRAGLRFTPVNWHLTADEARYIVEDCEAKAIVATADVAHVAAPSLASGHLIAALVAGGDADGFDSFEVARDAEDAGPLEDPQLGTSMLYTSGTTGRPKGVIRPPAATAVVANLLAIREEGGDMSLCTGPLYHAAPLAFSLRLPLAYGAGVVVMERWDAQETLALIERHRVTHVHLVPTMFHRLLQLPEPVRQQYDLSSLRHVLHGAAPCPVPVKRRIIEWLGPIVWEYYAATEGAGSFVDSATWLAHPGTVGKPVPADQVMVGDDFGAPLPNGEVGLVYLKAPAAGKFRYFKDEAKTDATYRGDYFTLGDIGFFDDEGFLYLTDRSANLIISGGVNIYPAEVDAVLLEHPAVGDAAVIGVPDEEWGESVLAVVEVRPGVEATPALAEELAEFCRAHLAHFKCPRRVEFVDALPRADNGKIYKRQLRERFRAAAQTEGAP